MLLVLAAATSQAQARAIDKSAAARESRIALNDYADHRCDLRLRCDYASYPDITKYDCFWFDRRRAARCVGSVELQLDSEADFPTDHCIADVVVRRGRIPRISGWECLPF